MLRCLGCWGWDVGVWVWGRRRRCGWVLGVLGFGRWADGDDVRTAFAVRGGARWQLCEVRQHRGRRHRGGSCVARAARVFHVKHDVYRVAGGRRRRRYLVLKGGGRKGLSTKTDKSSLPYKTPWNFYREGMKLPVFACICLKLSVCTCVYSSGVGEGGLLDLFHKVSLGA